MTATSQHGFHPDAESLSAFSEQALQERERAGVLAHLAVCARCRQVVALAREAADADAPAATAPTRKATEPNAWWKQWRLVWVPAAVAVAFAVTTISVYIEQADRHGSNIKVAEQHTTQGTVPSSTPAPTEQAEAVPPASPAPASPAHAAKHAQPAVAKPLPAPAPPVVTAQMSPEPGALAPEPMDQVEVTPEAPPLSHAEAQQAPPEVTAGAMRPAYSQPAAGAWEAKQKQVEQQRQAEVDTLRMRHFKAKAAPAVVPDANQSAPAGATESVTVTAAPPLETHPVALAEPALMLGIKSPGTATTPARPMLLPSGLAAVSIASGGHFLLAIDKAGALFLSEDRGVTWERIARQWTGRAVAVRQKARVHGASPAAPAAQNGTTGSSSADAGPAPSLTEFFELSNDENHTWVSTDGRTWTPK